MIYLLYTVFNLAFTLLAILLSPLLALFVNSEGNLPRYLSWFQTFDATVDEGWKGGYYGTFSEAPVGLTLYGLRVMWLIRNPAYGFCYGPLGMPFDPTQWVVTKYVTGPDYTNFHARSTNGLWCISYNGVFGSWKLGWKAWNYFEGMDEQGNPKWRTTPWGPNWRVPISFTPNFIKGITRLFAKPAAPAAAGA